MCGLSTPSAPPDITNAILASTSRGARPRCGASASRNAATAYSRVKSLTPPLPSVLPSTAMISDGATLPLSISAISPETSPGPLVGIRKTSTCDWPFGHSASPLDLKINRRSANLMARTSARRRPRLPGISGHNERAAGLFVAAAAPFSTFQARRVADRRADDNSRAAARSEPAARSPACRRVELAHGNASSLTACGPRGHSAGGSAVMPKAFEAKWRTRQDSNLWPLPSEGSALSS